MGGALECLLGWREADVGPFRLLVGHRCVTFRKEIGGSHPNRARYSSSQLRFVTLLFKGGSEGGSGVKA